MVRLIVSCKANTCDALGSRANQHHRREPMEQLPDGRRLHGRRARLAQRSGGLGAIFQRDHLGSIAVLIDETGTVAERDAYDP